MAVPTAAFAGAGSGPESRRSPRMSELWNITGGSGGSADGDQVTITTRYMHVPQIVIGGVSYTVSARTAVITLITALAQGEVLGIEIIGQP